MEFKGIFKEYTRNIMDGSGTVSFAVQTINPEHLNTLVNKDLRITAKQWREKRSLSANAYFHVLCDKLRKSLSISMARCKNQLISSYGQIEYIDNEPMIYKTNAPEEYMMELETLHTKCIKISEEKGKPVYYYRIYRGSHTYDSAEMARLIDGTVEECKEQGIETMTSAELERLVKMWGTKQER